MSTKGIFKNKKGFTLAETLLVVLLILIVSGILASGIPTVIRVYHNITDASNAQALISTTMTELRDKIALATDIKNGATPSSELNFVSEDGREYTLTSTKEGLYLDDHTSSEYGEKNSRLLVTDSAAARNLCAVFKTVSYTSGIVTFDNLKVCRKKEVDDKGIENANALVEIETYKVKVIKNTN